MMGTPFLRRVAAPNIYKSTLELIELWQLRMSIAGKNSTGEKRRAMERSMARYQGLRVSSLEEEAMDNGDLYLVLRRQILQAKRAGVPVPDLTEDDKILDEDVFSHGWGTRSLCLPSYHTPSTPSMLIPTPSTQGHDSNVNTLCRFVRFMEAYPSIQTELRTTLQAAFPGPALPSATDIVEATIPYLDGACEETFRLAGTAKANLRQALVDTQILGCPVPKGAEIFMNYHINRAPAPVDEAKRSVSSRCRPDGFLRVPGRDLASFQPRRWVVRDETTGEERFNPTALPSLAFDSRFRGCFGTYSLATLQLIITWEKVADRGCLWISRSQIGHDGGEDCGGATDLDV